MEPITDLEKGTIVELLLSENIKDFARKFVEGIPGSPLRVFAGDKPSMVLNSGSAVGYVLGVNSEMIELGPLKVKEDYDVDAREVDTVQYEWGTIMDLRVLE